MAGQNRGPGALTQLFTGTHVETIHMTADEAVKAGIAEWTGNLFTGYYAGPVTRTRP